MVPFWGVMRRRSGWFAGGVSGGVGFSICVGLFISQETERERERQWGEEI